MGTVKQVDPATLDLTHTRIEGAFIGLKYEPQLAEEPSPKEPLSLPAKLAELGPSTAPKQPAPSKSTAGEQCV